MYKIETIIDGHWTDDAVGSENKFDTREDAEELIPILAKQFDCPRDELRVVEK